MAFGSMGDSGAPPPSVPPCEIREIFLRQKRKEYEARLKVLSKSLEEKARHIETAGALEAREMGRQRESLERERGLELERLFALGKESAELLEHDQVWARARLNAERKVGRKQRRSTWQS